MSGADADLKARVQRALAEEAAPALHVDGIDVEVVDVADGVARVRVPACAGCPSTIMTVVMTLEQELRRRVPQVRYLEVVP